MQTNSFKLAVIGFGEAGRAFASGWSRPEGMVICAYDPKASDDATRAAFAAAAGAAQVTLAATNIAAVEHADAIFSLVTADRAHEAARECAAQIKPGAFFFDCNSCSPATRRPRQRSLEMPADAMSMLLSWPPFIPNGMKRRSF